MTACDQELCPNWDGHSCPCQLFGIGKFGDDKKRAATLAATLLAAARVAEAVPGECSRSTSELRAYVATMTYEDLP